MKGKWAQGLEPRAFTWIIKGRIAASERPGGYARNHRKVRRDEELIWLKHQGFTRILSLLESPHNLAAYAEFGISYVHIPLRRPGHEAEALPEIFRTLVEWYQRPDEVVLVHYEEFGDRLCGVIGGFLLATGLIEGEATAVAVTERLTGRQLGPAGRDIVHTTIMEGLAPRTPPPEAVPAPVADDERAAATRSDDGAKPAKRAKRAEKKPAKKAGTKRAKGASPQRSRPASRSNSATRGSAKAKSRAGRRRPSSASKASKTARNAGSKSSGSKNSGSKTTKRRPAKSEK